MTAENSQPHGSRFTSFQIRPAPAVRRREAPASEAEKRFVGEFDPSQTLGTADDKPEHVVIIPRLENTWPLSQKKNLPPPLETPSADSDPPHFIVDQLHSAPASAANMSYGLNFRSKTRSDDAYAGAAAAAGASAVDARSEMHISDEEKLRIDILSLADDVGIDEFDKIPVSDFGRAVLGGYGWKEGRGIGRKAEEDVPVVEPKRWIGTRGLGFNPDAPESRKKEKRAESRDAEQGRHTMDKNGEILPGVDEEILGSRPPRRGGGPVLILHGRHKGVMAMLMEKHEEKETAIVQVANSEEMVEVRMEHIAELSGDPDEFGF